MKYLLAALLFLALCGTVQAQRISATTNITLYAAPTGNDFNPCTQVLPCKTISWTVQYGMVSYDFAGHYFFVQLADGTYTDAVDVVEQPVGIHLVQIVGDCANPDAVISNITNGQPNFWAEDHATVVINCLKVQGNGSGFSCRQYAILDVDSVDFGPLSSGISANDNCRVNIGNVANAPITKITGPATVWAFATNHAVINIPGIPISIPSPITIAYMLLSYYGAAIDVVSASFGPASVTGQQYLVYEGGQLFTDGATLAGTTAGSNIGGSGFVY